MIVKFNIGEQVRFGKLIGKVVNRYYVVQFATKQKNDRSVKEFAEWVKRTFNYLQTEKWSR